MEQMYIVSGQGGAVDSVIVGPWSVGCQLGAMVEGVSPWGVRQEFLVDREGLCRDVFYRNVREGPCGDVVSSLAPAISVPMRPAAPER